MDTRLHAPQAGPRPRPDPRYTAALTALFKDARYDGRGEKYAHPERARQRMREILARIGEPHLRFRALHITGTKGKGSTSAMAESMLRHLGCRTGLFTSPHLHTFRERIRVDGQLMDPDHLVDLVERLWADFQAIPDLTVFDKITAMAFRYFADQGVEVAVVEVGLGGRLDSTNVLEPAVCGITRIGMDHMHVLGETLTRIAWEKAGIIKPQVPVYTCPQEPEALAVLLAVAQERRAPLHVVEPLHGTGLPLAGRFQEVNAAVAWHMVQEFARQGHIRWDEARAREGLAATWWPGRFEMLPLPSGSPVPLLVDCAHNIDSIRALMDNLAAYFPGRPLSFIFGANRDKDLSPIFPLLLEASPRLILVASRHPKARPAQELAQELDEVLARHPVWPVPQIHVAHTMDEALQVAAGWTPPEGLMVGTGSVFVVAELREAWFARYPWLFSAQDWVRAAAEEPLLAPAALPTLDMRP